MGGGGTEVGAGRVVYALTTEATGDMASHSRCGRSLALLLPTQASIRPSSGKCQPSPPHLCRLELLQLCQPLRALLGANKLPGGGGSCRRHRYSGGGGSRTSEQAGKQAGKAEEPPLARARTLGIRWCTGRGGRAMSLPSM